MKLSLATLAGLSSLVSGYAPQAPLQPVSRHPLTHDLLAFHKNLTQIESITSNEATVGQWLHDSLKAQGYNVEKQIVGDKHAESPRFNVLAWPGKERNAPVLLSSHIDTVPPFYPYKNPHGTISGRGSVDAKASVATQILAVNNLIAAGKISASDVAVLYVVGEETGGDGMRAANDLGLTPHTILFGEPTEGTLASGHKGNLRLRLTAKGKAAHSGYPWLGRSANEVLVSALAALMRLPETLPQSDKYGQTTINIGRIEGGVASNVVSQDAFADIAARVAAGTPADIKKAMTAAIEEAVQPFLKEGLTPSDVVDIDFPSAGYGPVNIDADIPGFKVMTVNYGTDIPNFKRPEDGAEQKRYLYGPGSILVAHSDHEAITEKQLVEGMEGYERILKYVLNGEKEDVKHDL